ncbi:MAG: gliding motility lipoprotein GldD [Crocinitomicaceae bacterium]
MKHSKLILILGAIIGFIGCTDEDAVYPKPISSMKISFPKKVFSKTVSRCDFSFKVADYTEVDSSKGLCNIDLNYKGLNATLFLTYIPIDTGLMYHIENARKLVYEHSIKADGIDEKLIINPMKNVYGTAYRLIGNTASNYQFYVTDSNHHFLRGALYFNSKPNYDSLKPSISFLIPDFDTLVNTIEW